MKRERDTVLLPILVDAGILIPKCVFERLLVNMCWNLTFSNCATVVGNANLPWAVHGATLFLPNPVLGCPGSGVWKGQSPTLSAVPKSALMTTYFWLKILALNGLTWQLFRYVSSVVRWLSKSSSPLSFLWNEPFLAQANVSYAHPALRGKPWHFVPKQHV